MNGRLLHGLLHPEIGHTRIPHDRARDPFDGVCPYHGDCLEGLASGEAIRQRWGRPAEELSADPAVWELESEYLALGLMNVICTLSPQRIVVGGGVPKQRTLLSLLRRRLQELLAGYFNAPELTQPDAIDRYIVPPALGDQSGVLGAIELARTSVAASSTAAARAEGLSCANRLQPAGGVALRIVRDRGRAGAHGFARASRALGPRPTSRSSTRSTSFSSL